MWLLDTAGDFVVNKARATMRSLTATIAREEEAQFSFVKNLDEAPSWSCYFDIT